MASLKKLKPKNPHYWILPMIFLFSIAVRLIVAFKTPNFAVDSAYFGLRQVESILQTGLPLFNDPLSYGGRFHMFPPLFYYVLATFGAFMKIELVGKIIPNILASTVVFITFLIAREMTKNTNVALITSFGATFIPVYMKETINTVSPFSLAVPLSLFMIYSFMMIKKHVKYVYYYLASLAALSLTHSSIALVGAGLLFYVILVRAEKADYRKAELETVLFTFFFIIWSQLVLYKKAFLLHGPLALWNNIPLKIADSYFTSINIAEAFALIGLIPFVFGMYTIFKYTLVEKRKHIYLFAMLSLSVIILMFLKMVQFETALIFTGFFLTILSSQFLRDSISYVRKIRYVKVEAMFVIIIMALLVLTSLFPSLIFSDRLNTGAFRQSEIKAMAFLSENSPQSSVVLASPFEGNVLAFEAKRKNVMDSNFLYQSDVDQRFDDIRTAYTIRFETKALEVLEKYGVNYIYLSGRGMSYYNITDVSYLTDQNCFTLVYDDQQRIYKKICELSKSG